MRVKVLLQITADDGTAGDAVEVAVFEKQTERPEDLGLSITEGKALMAAVQQRVVDIQAASWAERQRCCEVCGTRRHSKGSYPVIFMTLYGDVKLSSLRLHRCPCQGTDGPATVSPLRALIPDYVAPERLYLEARWASLVPYASAAGWRHTLGSPFTSLEPLCPCRSNTMLNTATTFPSPDIGSPTGQSMTRH